MNDSTNDIDDEEIFPLPEADLPANNQRIAIRYLRTDITASLTKPGLFNCSKNIAVKLLDISSKGATIECEEKLAINKTIIFKLVFQDKQSFEMMAKIVHQAKNNEKEYGLKFDRFNDELGACLMASQSDFLFK